MAMCLTKLATESSSSSISHAHNNNGSSAPIMETAKLTPTSGNSSATPTPEYPARSSPPSSLGRGSPQLNHHSNHHHHHHHRGGGGISPPLRGGGGASPPPTLVPSAMSMVSMASMLGHPGGMPPSLFSMGYPRDLGGRNHGIDDFASSMHKFMDRSFGDSPPPPSVPTNDPTANECKIVEYRGEKLAAFTISGKTMLCLPQAFELFLKHLVGGLHTVYTKLKRLEITPIVCNVEQVRILRGLGAIQPGVNRCKLLADTDFDTLYKDCTTSSSRPGRPPKRGVPFPPMSPQDAMLHLKSIHNGGDPYKDGPYPKEPRLDKNPFGNGFGPHGHPGLNPMAAQFMALNHPAAAQAAQAAFLSHSAAGGGGGGPGLPPFGGLPVVTSSPSIPGRPEPQNFMKNPGFSSLEALQRSGLFGAAYLERMREGQRTLQDQQERAAAAAAAAAAAVAATDQDKRDRRHSDGLSSEEKDRSHRMHHDARRDSLERSSSLHRNHSDHQPHHQHHQQQPHRDGGSNSPVLNLSKPSGSESPISDPGHHRLGDVEEEEEEDVVSDDDIAPVSDKKEDKENNNRDILANGKGPVNPTSIPGFPSNLVENMAAMAAASGQTGGGDGQLNSVYGLIGNIQALLKMAVENAKKDESPTITKSDPKTDIGLSKGQPNKAPMSRTTPSGSIHDELEEMKKNSQIYLKRFKKEKRYRRKLQEQLELETKRRVQMEEALKMTSAETLKRITESMHKEMEEKQMNESVDIRKDSSDSLEGRGSNYGQSRRDSLGPRGAGEDSPGLPSTPKSHDGSSVGEDDEDEDDTHGLNKSSSSSSLHPQYNAKVSSTSDNGKNGSRGGNNASAIGGVTTATIGGASTPPRDAPTIGFAKNLFPFNGSSLFGSAN
ncbi:hypothetical protein TCAL_07775 [Tigriopus californicus]|uniref:SKI/SNO/DAC domain-containing protein n=1 Tax=Tigriopus californicus TaxID=6832 RepID=A0A553P885_TIGCA|nr:dachshund homolog 1-like isoform X1 [Tigriopus californicus]TRY73892.1 hypothetical protein TCAL_07775 [Tigriopus californicus]